MMNNDPAIPESFFRAAQTLGASPIFAQGAGGNLSWKDGDVMYVKASGCLLKNVAPGSGYVACQFRPIAAYLATTSTPSNNLEPRSHGEENKFNAVIESNLIPGQSFGVPSIETGIHAILARAAIHTHSVYANAISCMDGGAKILHGLFSGKKLGGPVLVIPYANPGLNLARALYIENQRTALPKIIFLANHGLLTQADTLDEALQLTLNVNTILEEYLQQKNIAPFKVAEASTPETSYDFKKHLFPDSVVYASIDFKTLPPEKHIPFHEIGSASQYIVETIAKLGGTPNFFDERDVDFIANMDREKHRMKMARET